MSTTPDIIEIVKELQASHSPGTYILCEWYSGSIFPQFKVTGSQAVHLARLHNVFPAIASALLERDERVAHLEQEARYGNISYKEAVRLQEENKMMREWITHISEHFDLSTHDNGTTWKLLKAVCDGAKKVLSSLPKS